MSRVKDNHHKDKFYLSNPNKNWGENELHRAKGVSAHPEKLRGGVFTSKAGQQFGFNRLKERVNELNIRASATFGQEASMPSPSKLPGKTDSQGKIEEALSQLYDSVQASEYSNVTSNAQKVLSALYEGGDTLGSSLIADYSKNAFDIRRDMVVLMDGPIEYTMDFPAFASTNESKGSRNLSQFDLVKAKRKVKATLPIIDRILRLLDVIAKVANMSQPEKRQAIDASKGRDLREAERRFVNTPAFAEPGSFDEGTTKAVRGPTGERTGTELEQGIRPIPQDTGFSGDKADNLARARRYANIPDFSDFAEGDNASRETQSEPGWRGIPSVSSSMEARQSQRPGFYESGRGKGGCHSCEERDGGGLGDPDYHLDPESAELYRKRNYSKGDSKRWAERLEYLKKQKQGGEAQHIPRKPSEMYPGRPRGRGGEGPLPRERGLPPGVDTRKAYVPGTPRNGRGVGEGPSNDITAKEMFKQKMGRYPESNEELMEFMRTMNENTELPTDIGFESEATHTGKGRRGQPMTARQRRLAGRGKPRETEASILLKQLDDADDDQLTGGGKKKNTSKSYV
jgi:hypothetical protein